MDAISIELLTALAGGAGGAAGKQAWQALTQLIRRPFARPGDTPATPPLDGSVLEGPVLDAATELAALEQAPADVARARALSGALAERSAHDPEFARSLRAWADGARSLRVAEGSTHNTISGTVHGAAVQGRDFGSITFGAPEQRP